MYKFNPQHIDDLSGGKVILAHTKKDEDLPLLRAVLKEAFPNYSLVPTGVSKYFFAEKEYRYRFDTISYISCDMKMLPIIHLHDFLIKYNLPKEDLDRIDLMDKRLKEMESLLDTALSNETPETLKEWLLAKRAKPEIAQDWQPQVGEWFKNDLGALFLRIEGASGLITGNTQKDEDNVEFYTAQWLSKPTEEEVFNHLKSIAEKRYPVGTVLKNTGLAVTSDKSSGIVGSGIFNLTGSGLWVTSQDSWELCVWKDGKWAEIAEPKIDWLTRVRLDVYNEYDILVYTNTPKLTKDQADQTADLISWVLNNQETVLKLKNNDK
jgi:hypothetical protein